MHRFPLWARVVHLVFLFLVPIVLLGAPPLTTVQDTLFKADGTRFSGVAYIEWKSFQASDSSPIASSSVVVPIFDGVLRVRLVPTSNASAGARYFVRYHAEGRVQFTETWNVIPSASPVLLSAIRVANGAQSGGVTTPPASLTVGDVAGLADELDSRPIKGFGFAADRILKTGTTGALEAVQGNLSDCIRVDGTTGACGGESSAAAVPSFFDQDTPAGSVNGSNSVFTLTQSPAPPESLRLYRNGLLMKPGVDYSLAGATITFASLSLPQTGDLLQAEYRTSNGSNPSGAASGALTGTFPAPQIAQNVITNYNIASAAGIVESKLALQYPTHSNANDPAVNEKAALTGTAGAPSSTNKYVTDLDLRLTNARTAQPHGILAAEHADATPGTVQRGDLIVGSFATGSAKWTRLPLGGANRCLTSNGADAVWNTCLYTGFQAGAVPFADGSGNLSQSPMNLAWDNSNRRLSVGSNINLSTMSVHDGASNGSTTLTVRSGLSQGTNPLQTWQNSSGIDQASLGAGGVFAVKSVEAVSSATRAAWRDSGTSADPAVTVDGDAWYNTSEKAQKSKEAGQVHTLPQVICAANGPASTTSSLVSFATCSLPAGLLRAGDRLAIRATWSHTGAGSYLVRWRWGSAIAGSLSAAGTAGILDQKGEAALYTEGAVLDGTVRGTGGYPGAMFIENLTQNFDGGLTFALEGNNDLPGDSLRLIQFTVVRYPAQSNP